MSDEKPTRNFNKGAAPGGAPAVIVGTMYGAEVPAEIRAANAWINNNRARNMEKAMGNEGITPAAAAAEAPNYTSKEGVNFFTGPDKAREEKRRQGPPAALLNKHHNTP